MVSDVTAPRHRKRIPKPLTKASLNDLALSYVARFATTGAKLEAYLARKIRERGVVEGEVLDPRATAQRLVELKYVDDEAYARAKAGSLLRRGYGSRRVEEALRAAGVGDDVREETRPSERSAREAALAMVRKRGFGPYARGPVDMAKREKQIAAMIRAGHGFDAARALLDAETIEAAEEWVAEAED